jgi:hypothetical protein
MTASGFFLVLPQRAGLGNGKAEVEIADTADSCLD